MIRTAELTREAGWLGPDNSLCFRTACHLRQADSINVGSDYNMRKETGYIGLKNHGATCYMNGLLQSLYHVGEFRRIVYSIDCDDTGDTGDGKGDKGDGANRKRKDDEDGGDGGTPSLIQALQNVFYKLQTADQAVTCRELMKSFGWDNMDAFTQHDAQELNRILCDRLEERMKGTPMDGSIKKLFEGEMTNYIECCDIDYQSTRNETFYDVQLNIKGERGQELLNIEESLKDFTAEETLEGDNAYDAEGHGKQRAKKGIRFKRFPPVLNLQLKRFHFDLEKMDMVKLNTRFEFPTELDLREFAPGAGRYILHAVVVHSGDVNSGHYYAHIKPTPESNWIKFDDETVTPCSEFAAVEDNFGGSDLTVLNYFDRTPREQQHIVTPTRPRIHNAYMLVYIREDCAAEICTPPDPMVINSKMVERCDQEVHIAEQRRREKMEANLKIKIKLALEMDLVRMTGFWDHEKLTTEQSLKVGRDQLVRDLAVEVEQMIQVPRSHMVFFLLHYRNNPRQVRFAFMPPNTTFRSHIPQFNAPHFDTTNPYLMVLCVTSRGYDIKSLKWAPTTNVTKPDELAEWSDDNSVVLLIVKYFCPSTHNIITLGCYYISSGQKLIQMVNDGWVNERLEQQGGKEIAPLPEAGTFSWECWEEFSELDIQHRNVSTTVKHEQLWSGDVIIWQPVTKREGAGDQAGAEVPGDIGSPVTKPAEEPGAGNALYPVNNVADYAAHVANSIDAIVTLHDSRQPLTIDGAVSNGHWTIPRNAAKDAPATKKASPAREDRPEDAALQLSPAQFNMPREMELKMDLRWGLNHVIQAIALQFDLPPAVAESQLWLFHGAPSSSPEEPLNFDAGRTEQTTLKDVQRSVMYATVATKKPLNFHAVQLPVQPDHNIYDRSMCPLCLRFFDDATREVGNTTILASSNGTVADVLAEAEKHIQPEWNITGSLRVMEVVDSRVHEIYKPDVPIRSLLCFTKSNMFYHCLRIEADPEAAVTGKDGKKILEIFHCDRQSQQSFGQPFLLSVTPGEKAASIKARVKTKLLVPDAEFKSWRLVRASRATKVHLKDDDAWDSDPSADAKLCVEHSHPNPSSSLARQSRHNKPLTIK
eukprot:TRINITY_DN71608_c0_g1_i1.p1 TRINITY_DN71608_c0_g1~~TRINITY_DN71608_c0_g1_i1.p1  ORF type:complete len:1266 (-),score=243.44 TRINITY_DN71608_c0_g1_i1:366-3662(-)